MINKKCILFLDVLGFSELTKNNTPEMIKKIYDSEINQTAAVCSSMCGAVFNNLRDFQVISHKNGKLHDVKQNDINFHILSDSIVAWTNNAEIDSFSLLCQFAVTYLSMSLSLGLPLRGAISVGELDVIELPLNGTIQTNIVGSGLVSAHNYETEQNWMGCVITPESISHFGLDRILVAIKYLLIKSSVIVFLLMFSYQKNPESRDL